MSNTDFNVPKETIVIDVQGVDYKVNLAEVADQIKIDPNILDEELEEQAAFYFWIATLATNAAWLAESAKQEFDVWFSEQMSAIRASYEDEGGKIPAQTAIEAEAKANEEYSERHAELIAYRRDAALMEIAKEAVRMRQYTLIERSRRASKDQAAEAEAEAD